MPLNKDFIRFAITFVVLGTGLGGAFVLIIDGLAHWSVCRDFRRRRDLCELFAEHHMPHDRGIRWP